MTTFSQRTFLLSLLFPRVLSSTLILPSCYEPCANDFSGVEKVPGTGCTVYNVCFGGKVKNRVKCGGGLLFNDFAGYCDWDYLVDCTESTCPPTLSPSESPTKSPTLSPTTAPTNRPTKTPTLPPTNKPSDTPTMYPTASEFAMPVLRTSQSLLEEFVLISYSSSGIPYPSIKYFFDSLLSSLDIMSNQEFGANITFFLGNAHKDIYPYGLVNLAAFLANAMVESIQHDTCDELNHQVVAGRYAISNSCGQYGRSYQDEGCGEMYDCQVDRAMNITAVDVGNELRAPPPFTCRAGSGEGDYSGYWDTSSGMEIKNAPYSSTTGRTDVEGCCWWGRGALLTRNICNIGKLNYHLGARAAQDGRPSLYPEVDFCKYPESTCSSEYSKELIWTVAMFEWAERVQRYEDAKWNYMDQLTEFVNGGMIDDSFIESVGRILSVGCHDEGCSTIELSMVNQIMENFYLIVNDIFNVKSLMAGILPPNRSQPSIPESPSAIQKSTLSPAPLFVIPMPKLPITSQNDLPVHRPTIASPPPIKNVQSTHMPTSKESLLLLEENSAPKLYSFTGILELTLLLYFSYSSLRMCA